MKISIISSTRADFGLLKNLIIKLKREKKFLVSTIIGGSHFSKRFGYTFKEIIENKIKINKKIVFKSIPDSVSGISNVFSKSLIKSVEIFTLEIVTIPLPSRLKSFRIKSLRMIFISLLNLSLLL